jgi:acetyl esterase/lipase
MSRLNRSIVLRLAIGGLGCLFVSFTSATGTDPPRPDLANFSYGPHKRNVLDLWKAKSESPTPLVTFFNGGGFDKGDKSDIEPTLITQMLDAGISVMAANYRLTPQAKYPEHYQDCQRAIQTARHNSKEWNLDPTRFAATGVSAGGVISLWLAFRDDAADPKSDDPVLRESTRLKCAAVVATPVNLDPRDLTKWIGPRAVEHRFFRGAFFGLKPDQVYTPEGLAKFVEASPLTYLTRDDPPVWAFYHGPKETSGELTVSDAIHHYQSGVHLKQRMDELKVECVLLNIHDVKGGGTEMRDFLVSHLTK